jgi:hypothetical protein
MMIESAAVLACVIFAILAVLQMLLIAGLSLGNFAWGGAHKVLPNKLRIGSAASIGLYVLFAVIILEKSGLITIINNRTIVDIGTWTIMGYLFLGVVMNALSRSRPEQLVMTPVALVLSILFLLVALG